jgi:hypothetical protein
VTEIALGSDAVDLLRAEVSAAIDSVWGESSMVPKRIDSLIVSELPDLFAEFHEKKMLSALARQS